MGHLLVTSALMASAVFHEDALSHPPIRCYRIHLADINLPIIGAPIIVCRSTDRKPCQSNIRIVDLHNRTVEQSNLTVEPHSRTSQLNLRKSNLRKSKLTVEWQIRAPVTGDNGFTACTGSLHRHVYGSRSLISKFVFASIFHFYTSSECSEFFGVPFKLNSVSFGNKRAACLREDFKVLFERQQQWHW